MRWFWNLLQQTCLKPLLHECRKKSRCESGGENVKEKHCSAGTLTKRLKVGYREMKHGVKRKFQIWSTTFFMGNLINSLLRLWSVILFLRGVLVLAATCGTYRYYYYPVDPRNLTLISLTIRPRRLFRPPWPVATLPYLASVIHKYYIN